jgi:hypothetical protein
MADVRPLSQYREPRGSGAAVGITSFAFAVDPDTGHLYPTSEPTAIRVRAPETGNLRPSDDTTLTAARQRVAGGNRLRVY